MAASPAFAVLGFRPHTYWTSVVALGGRARAPTVLERRRVVFAAGDERSVFHQAAEIGPGEAARLIERVREATVANAVRGAVVSAATAKLPDKLEDIVTAHSRIHAAEGDFYRDVVAAACEVLGLEVRRVAERDMPALVCALLRTDRPSLDERLKDMGAALGPPWSEDYRLATQAAWIGLV